MIQIMDLKHVRLLLLVFSLLMVGLTGCETDRETSPILPGETAVLVLNFVPSPVYESYGNEYRFTVFIDEVNGVGATITSMKVESIDSEGNVIDTDNYDENRVVDTFGTSYIQAYGRLITSVEVECFGCARESWLVRAEDDEGNHVEYSQSVELIER
ncbi:hypothetical protein GF339_23415 [candidate division KSB3 bacterium]|uniref:Uncharacterized protein n=1 Tax=candidate division KSB3 bacterium TaxID=2044937 RepID=A0A9D5Q8K0_9BACT|nr:hypothetical protein [candidate division KSB3 bacterium]MBD3327553.1 hypothetical protein [candidate division KSB3 bacterium]